jgi:hypothetical protein
MSVNLLKISKPFLFSTANPDLILQPGFWRIKKPAAKTHFTSIVLPELK